MIVEYFTSEGVIHTSETGSRSNVVIPRKNETVYIAGKEYHVKSVSHEIDHTRRRMGQEETVHKISVELF